MRNRSLLIAMVVLFTATEAFAQAAAQADTPALSEQASFYPPSDELERVKKIDEEIALALLNRTLENFWPRDAQIPTAGRTIGDIIDRPIEFAGKHVPRGLADDFLLSVANTMVVEFCLVKEGYNVLEYVRREFADGIVAEQLEFRYDVNPLVNDVLSPEEAHGLKKVQDSEFFEVLLRRYPSSILDKATCLEAGFLCLRREKGRALELLNRLIENSDLLSKLANDVAGQPDGVPIATLVFMWNQLSHAYDMKFMLLSLLKADRKEIEAAVNDLRKKLGLPPRVLASLMEVRPENRPAELPPDRQPDVTTTDDESNMPNERIEKAATSPHAPGTKHGGSEGTAATGSIAPVIAVGIAGGILALVAVVIALRRVLR